MSSAGWIIAAGGALMLAIMLWPADGTRWSLRARTGRRRRAPLPAELPAGAAAGALMITADLTAGHAAAAAICAVVCTAAMKVLVTSSRRVATDEGVARLAGVAGQPGVGRGHRLRCGRQGRTPGKRPRRTRGDGHGRRLRERRGRHRGRAVRGPSALRGGRFPGWTWSPSQPRAAGAGPRTVAVLEAEAAQTAATARLFHARVATAMPTLALVVLLGAGLVAGAGQVATDVGAWLASTQGAALLTAGAVVTAALSARVLLPARAVARSGGMR